MAIGSNSSASPCSPDPDLGSSEAAARSCMRQKEHTPATIKIVEVSMNVVVMEKFIKSGINTAYT